jgi:hypothetical protein
VITIRTFSNRTDTKETDLVERRTVCWCGLLVVCSVWTESVAYLLNNLLKLCLTAWQIVTTVVTVWFAGQTWNNNNNQGRIYARATRARAQGGKFPGAAY